jgi:hypothetical protein
VNHSDELATLRREYPGFRIWMETIGGRTRYIACRTHLGKSPHTVVTTDLAELLAALAGEPRQQASARPSDTRPT